MKECGSDVVGCGCDVVECGYDVVGCEYDVLGCRDVVVRGNWKDDNLRREAELRGCVASDVIGSGVDVVECDSDVARFVRLISECVSGDEGCTSNVLACGVTALGCEGDMARYNVISDVLR